MKEGVWGRLEADTSYAVPSYASSACLQPAGVIEASIQDLFEAASQILAQWYQYNVSHVHRLGKSTIKYEK